MSFTRHHKRRLPVGISTNLFGFVTDINKVVLAKSRKKQISISIVHYEDQVSQRLPQTRAWLQRVERYLLYR